MFASCKEDNPGIVKITDWNGITETDNQGNITGSVDSTDWLSYQTWSADVIALFGYLDPNQACPSTPSHTTIAYPNPVKKSSEVLFISINDLGGMKFSYRLTDKYHNVYLSSDSLTSANMILGLEGIPEPVIQDTYRLYYAIFDGSCIFTSYGDIVIK